MLVHAMSNHTSCVHHWILGAPQLTKVYGVCRRCGARKSYPSGLEYLPDASVQYEELDRSHPLPAMEPASLGVYSLA